MEATPSPNQSYQQNQHGGSIGAGASKQNNQPSPSAYVGPSASCPTFTCDRCRQNVKPLPDTLPDWKTHLIACIIFILGLPFLCYLPYCFDCFGKPVKRCPKCGNFLNNTNPSAAPSAAQRQSQVR